MPEVRDEEEQIARLRFEYERFLILPGQVFVLQTILFPLFFLWATLQLLKRCVRAASAS